jgi:CheY-like chemotaxis protein
MPNVLIVDDDLMIADCLEEILIDAGYEVCGIASGVAETIALGEQHRPDLAIVDLRLSSGDLGTKVAAALRPFGVGILYATGNPGHPVFRDAVGEGCIAKPYTASTIVSALGIVGERMAKLPLSAFPRGFMLIEAQPA